MAAQRRISQDVFGVLVLADGRTLAPGDTIPVGVRVPRQYVAVSYTHLTLPTKRIV